MSEATLKRSIILPWPPRQLNPNGSHGHWAGKARARREYRRTCGRELVDQGVGGIEADSIDAEITFHPPDARRRDMDNMLASAKPAIDAVAERVGVDDSRWNLTLKRGPKMTLGSVRIRLSVPVRGRAA